MTIKLFSKLDYTATIPYGDTVLIVPPYSRGLLVPDEKKLGKLPKGIQAVKEKK